MKSETLYGFLLGDCLICAPTPETSDIAKIDTIPAYQTENVRQASSGKPVIVDSGSCSHICNEKTALTHLKQSPINGIRDVSGTISSVTGMGNTQTLTDVMLVPTSTHQLLSVGKLADQFGGEVVFTNKTVELRTAQGTKRVGSRSSDGLYTVTHPEFLFKRQTQTCAPISKEGKSLIGRSQVSLQMLKERMLRLHRIFGHANKEKLRTILKNNPSLKINPDHVKLLPGCRACSLGKVKRAPKPKLATTKAQSFAERIVADCSGRLRTLSRSGKRHACVCVDEWSGWCWAVPIASLKEVANVLQNLFCVSLHQRTDNVVRYFRSDNGTEFKNKAVSNLLQALGIQRELTCCPRSSYQSGKAE